MRPWRRQVYIGCQHQPHVGAPSAPKLITCSKNEQKCKMEGKQRRGLPTCASSELCSQTLPGLALLQPFHLFQRGI